MVQKDIRGYQDCPFCGKMCQIFVNITMVDCVYEIKAEMANVSSNLKSPSLYRKRGRTIKKDNQVIRFDQMEDIKVWTWMEI